MNYQTNVRFDYRNDQYSEFKLDEYRSRYEKLVAHGKEQVLTSFYSSTKKNLSLFRRRVAAFSFRSNYIAAKSFS